MSDKYKVTTLFYIFIVYYFIHIKFINLVSVAMYINVDNNCFTTDLKHIFKHKTLFYAKFSLKTSITANTKLLLPSFLLLNAFFAGKSAIFQVSFPAIRVVTI
jgi:hypothetical protein